MNIYKIIFFITASSQIVSTFFTSFKGGSNFNELLITPVGYTFSIWGVITFFSTIYAIYHLFKKETFSKQTYLLLSFVYICFTLWLLFAEREMFLETVAVFLCMYIALLKVFPELIKKGFHTLWDKIFLQGGVGMYLGWSSVAFIANIGVYLFSFGVQNNSSFGIYLQAFLLLLATLSARFVLIKSKFNPIVFGTHYWAFIGIIVGLFSRQNTTPLILLTILCVIYLNIFYFKKSK